MTSRLLPARAAVLATLVAGAAHAQVADRYGAPASPASPAPAATYGAPQAYAAPAYPAAYAPPAGPQPVYVAPVRAPPLRQLSWPGKNAPAAPVAPAPMTYASAAYPQTQGGYIAAPPQGFAAPPAPAPVAYPPLQAPAPSPTLRYTPAPKPVGGQIAASRRTVAPNTPVALAPPQPPAYARPYVGDPRIPTAVLPLPYAPAYPAAGAGAPGAPGATPASGYVAPAAVAAPPQVGTSRIYSLHREYGMQPDPAPVPPQFFGPTADLTTPETEDPAALNRRNTATGKVTRNVAAAAESPST